jgi:hypothetical protein
MDNSFPQQGSDTRQRRGFLAGLQILNRFVTWLARLVQLARLTDKEQDYAGIHLAQLTEEEQKDIGIYQGD